jgi:acyl carrier protein phosphodiesterase
VQAVQRADRRSVHRIDDGLAGGGNTAHHAPIGKREPNALNYLGHLYLSAPDEDALLGSLLGDFVKGPLGGKFPPPVTHAIALHRRLDSFTDAHPAVRASKARVSRVRRRYAGIMVDVFYDHFLAKNWPLLHTEPLAAFSRHVYGILDRRLDELPERLQRIAPVMMQFDWLGSYAEIESIYTALNRMSQRLRRENTLFDSADELLGNYAQMEADFHAFLPDAAAFAQQHVYRCAGQRC